jgi:exodeoxyribonuclease VIII
MTIVTKEPAILQDGLNDCDNSDYHADRKYLSSSVLKSVYKSLDNYYNEYILGNKREISSSTQSAFDLGSLVHSYILEPDKTLNDFAFFTGFRKAGKEYEEFLESQKTGKTVVSSAQKQQAEAMIESFKTCDAAKNLISNGFAEQTICGSLKGVPIKVRFDWINVEAGYIADVKTTSYPSDKESFKLTIDGLSYNLSAALYCAMAEQFYGKKFDFYFIVLSKKDRTCDVFKTSEETMQTGLDMVYKALAKYKKAKETNVWTELVDSARILKDTDYVIEEI